MKCQPHTDAPSHLDGRQRSGLPMDDPHREDHMPLKEKHPSIHFIDFLQVLPVEILGNRQQIKRSYESSDSLA